MNEFLTSITSFLAIWFNDFKKHVFKVQVVNDKQSDFSGVEKKIGAIVSSLNLLSAELSRSSSATNNEYIKGMVKRIDVLLSLLKNNKDMNLSRLESSVDSLVKVMRRAEITGDVKVTNFPNTQKVEGDVKLSNMQEIIKGLQVVVDAINSLKIDLSHEVKGMSTTFMGGAGSRAAHKITDGTDTVTITTVGSDKALDVNVVQTTGSGSGGDASAANQVLQTALLTTIDADTGNISTKTDTVATNTTTLAGTVTGGRVQVDSSTTNVAQSGSWTVIADAGVGLTDVATQTTLAAINTKLVTGTDIGDVTINNAAGASAVNIQDGGNTITVDGTVAVTNAGITTIAGAVSGTEMQVDVLTLPAIPAGTNNIGDVDVLSIAAGNNNIGDVDIASIAAGDNNIGNVDIVSGTVTTVSTLTGGGIAHDSADSGNPHKIGMKAFSPDGTTPGTAVAENDRTDAKADLDGRLYVNNVHPRRGHKHLDGTTAYTDESLVADPGDGFQVVITSITFSSGEAVAINFFLEEGTTKIFGPIYIEAVAGRGYVSGPIHLPVTASTAVTLTTSAGNDQSFDMDYFIQAV